jgi:transposase
MARLSEHIPARQAHKKSGGQEQQALGRSRGGFSTKIHITVDGLGNPLRLRLTAGQTHESTQARALLTGLRGQHVIADRGYAGQPLVDWIVEQGALAVIPPHQRAKQPHNYDTWRYRERHLIECFVSKLKHFRRVFSRFDKLASRYLGFLQLVSTLVWLR